MDDQRDIYKTFDSEDQMNQGIPSNPMDFIDRLRRAGAMDEATTPSDAIDEALQLFIDSENKNVPVE